MKSSNSCCSSRIRTCACIVALVATRCCCVVLLFFPLLRASVQYQLRMNWFTDEDVAAAKDAVLEPLAQIRARRTPSGRAKIAECAATLQPSSHNQHASLTTPPSLRPYRCHQQIVLRLERLAQGGGGATEARKLVAETAALLGALSFELDAARPGAFVGDYVQRMRGRYAPTIGGHVAALLRRLELEEEAAPELADPQPPADTAPQAPSPTPASPQDPLAAELAKVRRQATTVSHFSRGLTDPARCFPTIVLPAQPRKPLPPKRPQQKQQQPPSQTARPSHKRKRGW